MGNWAIIIEGVGWHHNNGRPDDADQLARQVVQTLVEAGQTVTHAAFVSGSAENFTPLHARCPRPE